MNFNRIFKQMLLGSCLSLFPAAALAQQGTVVKDGKPYFSGNWFVSGSLGSQWMLSGNAGSGRVFAVHASGGTWFNKYSGVRLNYSVKMQKLDGSRSTGNHAVGVDYLLNVLPLFGEYDAKNRFSLAFSAGVAYNMMRARDEQGDRVNKPSFNVSVSAGYDFTSHWGIFTELRGDMMERFYNENSRRPNCAADLSIGFRYYFRKHDYTRERPSDGKAEACARQLKALTGEVARLNDEVDALRKKVDEFDLLKKDNRTVVLTPAQEQVSVDVFFDRFSSFISGEQREKIAIIGREMKKNDFDICIVAFSDNTSDKVVDEKLRTNRTEAIRKLLTEDYGVDAKRITVVKAEDLGYQNQTGCNAKIFFIDTEK